uniref:Uncharacterized protein n=1 Tax=Rhodnius prolixus TaxID=13249 RepID=T1IDQ9_RHOPR
MLVASDQRDRRAASKESHAHSESLVAFLLSTRHYGGIISIRKFFLEKLAFMAAYMQELCVHDINRTRHGHGVFHHLYQQLRQHPARFNIQPPVQDFLQKKTQDTTPSLTNQTMHTWN